MANSPYENTVILDSDALNKLMSLMKQYPVAGQQTGIKLASAYGGYNLQIQNAHHYVSTSGMASNYDSSDIWQKDIYDTFGSTSGEYWASNHAAQICIIDDSVPDKTIGSKRYTWIQGGNLLEFYLSKGSSKADSYNKTEYNKLTSTPNGTFIVEENNGTKYHVVTVNGFKNGVYEGAISITGQNNKIYVESSADIGLHYHYSSTSDTGGLDSEQNASIHTEGGIEAEKCIKAYKIYGAVFNDYAEYRLTDNLAPGTCIIEQGNGKLILSTERLQAGANIISDTYGFSIGKSDKAKTPVAVCGRVLAYVENSIDELKPGDAMCTAPNGKISKMTREEIKEWPDRIVGYISEIPTYEYWGDDNVKVDGRVWIKVN